MFKKISYFFIIFNFLIIFAAVIYRSPAMENKGEDFDVFRNELNIASATIIDDEVEVSLFDSEEPVLIAEVKNLQEKKKARDDKLIRINIPEMVLRLYKRDADTKEYILEKSFNIAVGSYNNQTPIGEGFVYTKGTIYFKYKYGKRAGSIVSNARISPFSGKKEPIPYRKMKGLYLDINNKRSFVIHSTTEHWSIGRAVSAGCIRMKINDMLELYPLIPTGTRIKISYKTLVADAGRITIYPDIYGIGTNELKNVLKTLRLKGFDMTMLDRRKLDTVLKGVALSKKPQKNLLVDDFLLKSNSYRTPDILTELLENDKFLISY